MQRLRGLGHDVIGIDIRHSHDGVRADIANWEQISRLPDVDLVYHLAAEFGRHNGEDYTEQLWRSNVVGTKNMIRLQEQRGFRMVFASSSEVYGERGDVELTEDMPPIYLHNDYAMTKQVNEAQIANSSGKTMILRLCNSYGPGEYYHAYRSVVCLFCYRALAGIPHTVYRGYWRAFQYIDDMIKTMALCAERFFPGEIINLAGGDYRSVEELSEIVVAEVGGGIGVIAEIDGRNVVVKRLSNEKAKRLLGHDPQTKLEDGVYETVQWMSRVYDIPVHGVQRQAGAA